MIFELSRFVLFVLIAALCILVMRNRKKWIAVLIGIAGLAVYTFFAVVPVENLFLEFESPESAFRYYCKGKIIDIEQGDESCMIFYFRKANEFGQVIIPKTENGYEIPGFYDKKNVVQKNYGYGIATVYTLSGTDDYYVFLATCTYEDDISVSDSNGRQLETIVMETGVEGLKNVFVSSFVEEYTPDYCLFVDDSTMELGRE